MLPFASGTSTVFNEPSMVFRCLKELFGEFNTKDWKVKSFNIVQDNSVVFLLSVILFAILRGEFYQKRP